MYDYLTVKDFAKKYPTFSESTLRHWYRKREQNNMQDAFHKIGRTILISETKFFKKTAE